MTCTKECKAARVAWNAAWNAAWDAVRDAVRDATKAEWVVLKSEHEKCKENP